MADRLERVCVVGLGYVGLPTAAVLATQGVGVIGVDTDAERVAAVNSGAAPIAEPDLDTLVHRAVTAGGLRAVSDVVRADAFIIAVPTPLTGDRRPDLGHLRSAAQSVARVLEPGNLVVLESTSPVGTTEELCRWLAAARPDLTFPHSAEESSDIRVAYSPERVLPGRILAELLDNDRIVGGITPACTEAASALYGIFLRGRCARTTARAAELVKLIENAYRDVNIAFANEMSLVSDALGVDAWEVIELANRHPRVDVLRPGPGVGGHCIAVDPWFIVHSTPELTPLIQAARRVNEDKPRRVVARVLDACAAFDRPIVACLGLAYKADVGDLRESPSVSIVERLAASLECRLLIVEPYIEALPDELRRNIAIELVDLEFALGVANVVVLLTDHREFRELDVDRLATKQMVDTRGVWRY